MCVCDLSACWLRFSLSARRGVALIGSTCTASYFSKHVSNWPGGGHYSVQVTPMSCRRSPGPPGLLRSFVKQCITNSCRNARSSITIADGHTQVPTATTSRLTMRHELCTSSAGATAATMLCRSAPHPALQCPSRWHFAHVTVVLSVHYASHGVGGPTHEA